MARLYHRKRTFFIYLLFFRNTDLHFTKKHLHKYTYKKKKNHKVIIQQKNKTYAILDPTLKQVIVRLQSNVAYIYTYNL